MIKIKKKLNEKILENTSKLPENISKWIKEHDLELIGKGNYSTVWSNDSLNYVVKINNIRKDEYLEKFINFCKNNKDYQEHLPKFGKILTIDNIDIVFMEKLLPFNIKLNNGIDGRVLNAFFRSVIEDYISAKTYKQMLKRFDKNWSYYKISNNTDLEAQFFDLSDILYNLIEEENISINIIDINFSNLFLRNDKIILGDPLG